MTKEQLEALMEYIKAVARRAAWGAVDTEDLSDMLAERSCEAALRRAFLQCACKTRAASDCPGEWEPGCDLGANENFVSPA